MRMRNAIIAAVLAVAIVAPQANAIGVMGSWWQQEDLNNGYGIGILKTFGVIPLISIDGRASWLHYNDKGAEANLFPLEVVGRVNLGMFYGGLGVGYYIFDGKNGAEIDNDIGGSILAGVGLGLAGVNVFGELKYTILETEIGFGGPKTKLDGNGFGINVGVTLPFF